MKLKEYNGKVTETYSEKNKIFELKFSLKERLQVLLFGKLLVRIFGTYLLEKED